MKLAVRLGIAGTFLAGNIGLLAQPQAPTITEFSVGSPSNNSPSGITVGVDGALWYTDVIANQIGRITPAGDVTTFPIPTAGSQPSGIAMGRDGALWFTEYAADKIGRITTAGVITEYPLTAGSNPRSITSGPDAALWFTEAGSNKIGRMTTGGLLTAEYLIPTPGSSPWAIVLGPDTNLWFTEFVGNKIARISAAGLIIEYPIPTANSHPQGIVPGPDGAMWFAENAGRIGRLRKGSIVGTTEITPAVIYEYNVPVVGSSPVAIVSGLDGALWYTAANSNNLGRMTTEGVATEYPTTSSDSGIQQIVIGPDSAFWFTQGKSGQIGRAIFPVTTPFSNGYGSFNNFNNFPPSPRMAILGPDGAIWLSTLGAIARLTADGGLSMYTQSASSPFSGPNGIAAGPDGAMWFTQPNTAQIGRIAPAGTYSGYTVVACKFCGPYSIVAGPQQDLWFTEINGVNVGRITTAGVITEFPVGAITTGIALGPDGALWFLLRQDSSYIGRLTTQGQYTQYPLPSGYGYSITAGADGALWIPGTGKIARMTTAGVVTEFTGITGSPGQLTLGGDGALWFSTGASLGRITTSGSITQYPGSWPSASTAIGSDGALWATGNSGDFIGRTALPTGAGSNITKVIGSNVPGLQLNVDGLSYYTPATFQWPIGSLHSINAGTPTNNPGTRYSFRSWSDGQPQAHTIAASVAPTVLIANFTPQYQLTLAASPLAGGSLTANPSSPGNFYDAGTSVQVTAAPNPGYGFCCFIGSPSASTNPQSISMTAPISVQAVFNPNSCIFTLSSNRALDGGAGGTGSVNVSTPAGCTWSATSNVSWVTVTSSSLTSGNGTVTYTIDPATGGGRTGSITIAGQDFIITQSVPAAVSVTPASGSGLTQTFTMQFFDSGGLQNISVVNILISSALDGRGACYIAIQPTSTASGSVFLVNDAGDAGGPYQGMVLPGSSTIQNSQCKLEGSGSSISTNGGMFIVTLAVTFKASFAGNKIVYMAARNAVQSPGWSALGTWNVPGGTTTNPAVGAVTPARGTTTNQTYTFTFTGAKGWADISVANILINSGIDGRNACYLAFVPSSATSGSLLLVNDAGAAGGPYAGLVLPGSSSIQNSQCIVDGSASSVTTNGNTLTLTLAITFNHAFSGNQIFYMAVRSSSQSSDWQAVGSVTVQ